MAKIGLFILSSNDKLFELSTKLLKNHYNKIINDNKLDVEVYSFMGSETDKETYEDGNVIYTKGSDNELYTKHDELHKFILKNKKYDYIIMTNPSTLVNLKLIYNNIDSFSKESYYGTITWDKEFKNFGKFKYPNGNFKLFSYDILTKMSEQWEKCRDLIHDEYIEFDAKYHQPDAKWTGVPDDMIIGVFLHTNKIPLIRINTTLLFPYYTSPVNLDKPIKQMPVIQFKMPFTRAYRILAEPYLLIYLTKQLEN